MSDEIQRTEPGRDWVRELVAIMSRLRAPDGCPWDREQTHESLKRFLVEESAELLDAIDEGDDAKIVDELGDVLLQVVFHARIAEEDGRFDLQGVARHCCEKIVRRHPHVFGDRQAATAADVLELWKEVKWEEQKQRNERPENASALGGVPRHLPALHRAYKLQKKAARVGFDWPTIDGVMAKIEEEFAEVRDALAQGDREAAGEEIGDLLFAVVNLSRFIGCEPEDRLRQTIRKFERRFAKIEAELRTRGKKPEECTLAELDALWEAGKREEREAGRE
ncbi:MAG: nucleoside triphosphate pyrophosphohydrolase [Kiritimatiellaeota bacterium]|nr:nucleoside triphosphate pyrophosphohydrolase [Kiritimatiellota bacterium]